MPPRKSTTSQVSEDGGASGFGVEDLSLPRTMVQRLAKGVLPPNTQVQKDAILAISKSATVFVSFLSSHANENAQRLNKKTIQPKDVLDAVRELEFEAFLPRLEAELAKYNAVQCDKRNSYRRKIREEQRAKTEVALGDHDGTTAEVTAGEEAPNGGAQGEKKMNGQSRGRGREEEPKAKKARGSDGMEVDEVEDDEEGDEDGDDQEADAQEEDGDESEESSSVEDEEEDGEFEDAKEELAEDPLEERMRGEDDDEAMDYASDDD